MKCPHCGVEIPNGSKFCLNCGKQINQDNTSSDSDEPNQSEISESAQRKIDSTVSEERDSSEPMPSLEAASEPEPVSIEVDTTVEETVVRPAINDGDTAAKNEPSESQSGAGNWDEKERSVSVPVQSDSEGSTSESENGEKRTGLKGKHPTWLLVLLCLFVPPVGIFLLWKWEKPKANIGKILLTVVLSLLTLLYVATIVTGVEEANEEKQAIEREKDEEKQAIESFSTLDSTYKKNGVKLSYPSAWKDHKTDVSGIFPSTNAYVGFTFYEPSELGENASDYNLTYETGFDSFADNVIATFNNSKGYHAGNPSKTKVLKNAMYRKFSCKVRSSDGATAHGTMVLYADADGNVFGMLVYVGDKIGDHKKEASQLIDDVVSSVKFTAKNFDHDPSENPIKSISATYAGDTTEGTTLDDSNSGIKVTATYADSATKVLGDEAWGIANPQTLKAGQTSTVTISAGNVTTNLSVKCTTMTEDQYKQSCQSISYDELLRNPDSYKGKDIKLRGKVLQSVDGTLLIYVTQGSYGIWDDITMIAWEGEPNVIEDDIITVWGTYTGTYTYTTALGSDKTVPLLAAKYVSIE